MPLNLRWKDTTTLPVEAEGLSCERFAGMSTRDIALSYITCGNRTVELGELFDVEGDASDGDLHMEGNLRHLRGLGTRHASGRMTIRGDVGPGLAVGMRGGEIDLDGSAGVWAGAEMTGGLLRISGNAGDGLGAALPGSRVGMREGVILVAGDAGDDVGLAMRRGLIAIGGRAGATLGRAMVAGSIFAFGPVGDHAGLGMKRGTLALFSDAAPTLLPTFAPSGRYRPPFLTIYLKQLRAWNFAVPEAVFGADIARYNGDQADHGQGEILVWG